MADTLDLVSTIGTWFGVGLALLALIGVVAPVLVWRATKSERNKALNALDQGGADTFGYISHGIWTGTRVRIFRRIRAPLLGSEPVLRSDGHANVLLRFRPAGGERQPSEESSGWVQFGSVVEAYNIKVAKGDALEIEKGSTWTPVHTSWLLLVGLLGRYGRWHDKGRLPWTIERGTTSTRATIRVPGVARARGQRGPSRQGRHGIPENYRDGSWTSYGWRTSSQAWEDSDNRRSSDGLSYRPLYGLTGTLFTPRMSREMRDARYGPRQQSPEDEHIKSKVFFLRHKNERSGNLGEETVSIGWLFWMAVGCIPTAENQVICLADVQDRQIIPDTPVSITSAPVSPAPHVRFQTDEETGSINSSDAGYYSPPHEPTHNMSGPSGPGPGISPANYLPQEPGGSARSVSFDPSSPQTLRLRPCNERLAHLSDFAALVHAESPGTQVLTLQEVALGDAEISSLVDENSGTYIARSSAWLRLTLPHGRLRGSYGSDLKFLHRSDGQTMAAGLLNLPLSPYGYLMSFENSLCRDMLCEAAQSVPQLLTRTMWKIEDSFDYLDSEKRGKLHNALAAFHNLSQPVKRTRLYFDALHKLDKALEETTVQTPTLRYVAISLGCVMITSPEFRSLISQSVRLLAEGFNGTMCVSLDDGLIRVPTVLNFLADFPVDLDAIFPNIDPNERNGVFNVSLNKVVLICLKAALRSAMLDSALDSRPLFEAVSSYGLEETPYMG